MARDHVKSTRHKIWKYCVICYFRIKRTGGHIKMAPGRILSPYDKGYHYLYELAAKHGLTVFLKIHRQANHKSPDRFLSF